MIEAGTLVATSREILTETDPALEVSNERLHALIQPCLNEWRTRTLKNREKLKNFMIETDPVTITNGEADLTDTLDTYGIPAEEIKKAQINIPGYATGTWTFNTNPANAESIVINGYLFTFYDGGGFPADPHEIVRGVTLAESLANLVTKLNAHADAAINVATYAAASATTVSGTYDTRGVVGETFTMANSSGGAITRSSAAFVLPPSLDVWFVNSHNRLKIGGRQDIFGICAHFDGKTMFFRDSANVINPLRSLDATMQITATVVPTTLDNIPVANTGELATIMAEIVRTMNTGKQPKGVDLSLQKGG